ncbi:MAG: PilZ domain-containing protein, partial [candidate division NC10 bacterium]
MSSYTHVRGSPRFMVWLPVQCTLLSQGARKVITGRTNSISPGGLGLLLPETVPLRTSVVVQVCLEEPLPGLVIWRDRPRPTGLGISIPHGVGFDFLVDPDLIRQWV